jgi:hypothetical protein
VIGRRPKKVNNMIGAINSAPKLRIERRPEGFERGFKIGLGTESCGGIKELGLESERVHGSPNLSLRLLVPLADFLVRPHFSFTMRGRKIIRSLILWAGAL